MPKINVNQNYELLQIMSDFGDPLEIFREGLQNSYDEKASEIYIIVNEEQRVNDREIVVEITDNGNGLHQKDVSKFFDVANSSKISEAFVKTKGKIGYKGHGAKVFFNARQVKICSKTADGEYWAAELNQPMEQMNENKDMEYSECMSPEKLNISLPSNWKSGFKVKIFAPKYFQSVQTRHKLEHINLRDYCKWFTVAGTIEPLYNKDFVAPTLYLSGLGFDVFMQKYNDLKACDPIPEYHKDKYEKIVFGHYMPPERSKKKDLVNYVDSIDSCKDKHMFYSKVIYNQDVVAKGITFRLIVGLEGYETKRRYDLLLTRRGQPRTENSHTDVSRYGLWACKDGVPVEKVDAWLEGGKGSYTYMHAFIDCDAFTLTANRGSIRNTGIDVIESIKDKVNEIFSSTSINNELQEREYFEKEDKIQQTVQTANEDLKTRYKNFAKKKTITFPDGYQVKEPCKLKNKNYSESETFALLVKIIERYPKLFDFKLLDYNTDKGIDFVVEKNNNPKYVELKGTLTKSINHPFECIYKFICYDSDIDESNCKIEDIEGITAYLKKYNNDSFVSPDKAFNDKSYTSYKIEPQTAGVQSMEVICLKSILKQVLGATID